MEDRILMALAVASLYIPAERKTPIALWTDAVYLNLACSVH